MPTADRPAQTIDAAPPADLLQREFRAMVCSVAAPSRHDNLFRLYLAAHAALPGLAEGHAEERAQILALIERDIDLWAVEPSLRRAGNPHLLTRKLALLQALLDADPQADSAPGPASLLADIASLPGELARLVIARFKAKAHGLL